MSKLVGSANNMEELLKLLKTDIDGVIISIKDLAVNDCFYIDIDDIDKIDFNNKEVFISVNKLMHNKDLKLLNRVMNKLKDMDVKILFYDMSVYNIAKRLNIVNKLVIYQDHLNASTLSNKFFKELGIEGSYITNDITYEELINIKKNTDSKIMFLGYGYQPIFYSRRYLISNYMDFIGDKKKDSKYEIVSDTDNKYPIVEEKYGTTIYTEEPINLINYLDLLKDIDYIVLRSNMINNKEYLEMVNRFIKHDKMDNTYIGFFNTKTIYRVK